MTSKLNHDLLVWIEKSRLRAKHRRHDLTAMNNQFVQAINLQHANEIEAILRKNNQKLKLNARMFRDRDPHTSKLGAQDVEMRAGSQRAQLLQAYKYASDGLTNYEAGVLGNLTNACYWKRCSELRRMGYIASTEQTRVNPSTGSEQTINVITEKGKKWLADHAD